MDEVAEPLKHLKSIQQQRAQLKREYDYWLAKALEDGYNNVRIAATLGVSETAIRNYRKRNGIGVK